MFIAGRKSERLEGFRTVFFLVLCVEWDSWWRCVRVCWSYHALFLSCIKGVYASLVTSNRRNSQGPSIWTCFCVKTCVMGWVTGKRGGGGEALLWRGQLLSIRLVYTWMWSAGVALLAQSSRRSIFLHPNLTIDERGMHHKFYFSKTRQIIAGPLRKTHTTINRKNPCLVQFFTGNKCKMDHIKNTWLCLLGHQFKSQDCSRFSMGSKFHCHRPKKRS